MTTCVRGLVYGFDACESTEDLGAPDRLCRSAPTLATRRRPGSLSLDMSR